MFVGSRSSIYSVVQRPDAVVEGSTQAQLCQHGPGELHQRGRAGNRSARVEGEVPSRHALAHGFAHVLEL